LAASLALTPAAKAYGRDAGTRASEHQAARTAAGQTSVNREKARNAYTVPAPPSVKWVRGVAPGTPAGVMSPAQTDFVTNPIYSTQPLERYDRAHEVGHLFDSQVLSPGDHNFFQKLMHAPAGAWYQGSAADTGGGPSEWFGDYYAAAVVDMDPDHEMLGNYAQIGPKRLKRFEKALQRLAERHNLKPYTG
jgi:hypothetical protein